MNVKQLTDICEIKRLELPLSGPVIFGRNLAAEEVQPTGGEGWGLGSGPSLVKLEQDRERDRTGDRDRDGPQGQCADGTAGGRSIQSSVLSLGHRGRRGLGWKDTDREFGVLGDQGLVFYLGYM